MHAVESSHVVTRTFIQKYCVSILGLQLNIPLFDIVFFSPQCIELSFSAHNLFISDLEDLF